MMMTVGHYRRWMGIASIVGGIGWILYHFVGNADIDWGAPGTAAYRTYETFNRLMALPLTCIGVGIVGMLLHQRRQLGLFGTASFIVLLTGIGLMVVGNIAEFWFFTHLPYVQGNLRERAWITFLLGALITVIGGFLAGFATWRASVFPRWSAAIFPFTLPFGIASILFGILLWFSSRQGMSRSRASS